MVTEIVPYYESNVEKCLFKSKGTQLECTDIKKNCEIITEVEER
jgi:hypothetical protein